MTLTEGLGIEDLSPLDVSAVTADGEAMLKVGLGHCVVLLVGSRLNNGVSTLNEPAVLSIRELRRYAVTAKILMYASQPAGTFKFGPSVNEFDPD